MCLFFARTSSKTALPFTFCLSPKALPFVCFFLFPKNTNDFWDTLLLSTPRRNGRTYDLVVASQTAFHFKFCQIAKLLPFTCLFLFPKSTLYFWGPHKNTRWLLSFLRKHSVSNAVRKVTNLIKKHTICGVHSLAPEIGFEPTTLWLTATCSTAELLRNINGYFAILANWKNNINNFTQFFYYYSKIFLQKFDIYIVSC